MTTNERLYSPRVVEQLVDPVGQGDCGYDQGGPLVGVWSVVRHSQLVEDLGLAVQVHLGPPDLPALGGRDNAGAVGHGAGLQGDLKWILLYGWQKNSKCGKFKL